MVGEETKTFDRDGMARWYAGRHLKTDAAIREIHYLPDGAPTNEIRLVEVNTLVSGVSPLEPIDFGVDIGNVDAHTLLVLDVTPDQWNAIDARRLGLPHGWSLDGRKTYSGGRG